MKDRGPYSRVYHTIADDPAFEKVYGNDRALATWLRMLIVADAMWPVSAPMIPRNPTVRMLIDCGLVLERAGNRYTIRGLQAERERRSSSARNAAAVRWQNERNADVMPKRAEPSRAEKSSADASRTGTIRPGSHNGQHPNCAVCEPLRQQHAD